MPARAACQKLIAFVRDLVGEAPAATPGSTDPCASALTDDSIQSALDETRERMRYETLEAEYTRLAGGAVAYKDYETSAYLDDAATLMDVSYVAFVESDFSDFDPFHGRFTFNQSQYPILFLVGNRYDPYRAAAQVLTKMAASVKSDVDFKDANTSLSASQAAKAMLALASEYRKMGRVHTIEFGRSDT